MSVSIDVEVKCEECGTELDATWDDRRCTLHVEPCERCVEKAEEKGDGKGYDRGLLEGQQSVKQ